MPRAFDVTATTSQVALTSSGQGEVSFTVSNKLREGVSVRASVVPSGATRAEWMQFPEGAERALLPDGTAVLPVRIAVPPGTPPGTYGFGLVVASVSNPDEHYDQGPAVAFTVAEALPVTKKPFPWWIVALAAGILLIVGGVVAVLALRGKEAPGVGAPCAQEAPKCAARLHCEAGTCREAVALGGACNSEDDCASPLACEQEVCRGPEGFKGCKQPGQCLTGRCEADSCQAQRVLGEKCDSADDCRAPMTCVPQQLCLVPVGEPCSNGSQCVTGVCTQDVCAAPPVVVACPVCRPTEFCNDRGECQRRILQIDPQILHRLEVREFDLKRERLRLPQ